MKDVKIHYKHKIMMFYNINSVCFLHQFLIVHSVNYMGRRKHSVDLVQTSPT